jgi:hypothetical protein
MGTGVAASFRPRRYYRVPKETLETFLDDVEQLINFFVIELQRVLFAENVAATVGVSILVRISSYEFLADVSFLLGLPLRFRLLLSDQVRPALGTYPHQHLRHLPRTLNLHQEQRSH